MKLYDTLSRKKKQLRKTKDALRLFVCGPTVYDHSHIGHARTYAMFDMLVKYLRHCGYTVRYVQNITDIDDKIINHAREEKTSPEKLAREFEKEYHADMAALGVDSVDTYARASDYIKEIIAQIELLIEKKHAYQTPGGVYFRVSTFERYGELARQDRAKLKTAVNIEDDPNKEDSADFALWKAAKPDEPTWESPWGKGRPGWHIEDTAITHKEFGGPQYELHGGARDLIFPHHEAEIAQMEAAYGKPPMVNAWMHTGFLRVKNEKMSKSLKNFITIRDILKTHSAHTLRTFFTTRLYRSPIDYTEEGLAEAKAISRRIGEFWSRLRAVREKQNADSSLPPLVKAFWDELEDDFNTPKAFAQLFTLVSSVNPKIDASLLGQADAEMLIAFLKEVNGIFNVVDEQHLGEAEAIPHHIREMALEREHLREEKKWVEADHLRREVEELGYEIKDTPSGPRIIKQ
jgi:cysteinyl-tRNA synthetase